MSAIKPLHSKNIMSRAMNFGIDLASVIASSSVDMSLKKRQPEELKCRRLP